MEKFQKKPLYYQLVDHLKEKIKANMIPHDKLPSERELAAQYQLSRTTGSCLFASRE